MSVLLPVAGFGSRYDFVRSTEYVVYILRTVRVYSILEEVGDQVSGTYLVGLTEDERRLLPILSTK